MLPTPDTYAAIDRMAELDDEIADLKEERDALARTVADSLAVGDVVTTDRATVRVSTRRTFRPGLAASLIEAEVPESERASLFKQEVDRKKVSALYPDLADRATTESEPYITVRRASDDD